MKPQLPTRQLGKTGVAIPVLGMGTAPAGTRLNLKNAIRLYEAALEFGITYFDTAPAFAGYGKAQTQLGHFLKDRRSEVFLVTKCYEPNGDKALRLLERNLKELQTDHADLVFVHSLGADKMQPQQVFSRNGCYAALQKAKALGLTKFIGFSGHNRPQRFVDAIQHYEVDVLLNAVNFVDRYTYNFEQRVWPMAAQRGIGLIAMKVYGGNARSKSAGLSQSLLHSSHMDLSFRYSLGQPHTACAVIGMATFRELQDNIIRVHQFKPLVRQELAHLEKIGTLLAKHWGPHLGAVV